MDLNRYLGLANRIHIAKRRPTGTRSTRPPSSCTTGTRRRWSGKLLSPRDACNIVRPRIREFVGGRIVPLRTRKSVLWNESLRRVNEFERDEEAKVLTLVIDREAGFLRAFRPRRPLRHLAFAIALCNA